MSAGLIEFDEGEVAELLLPPVVARHTIVPLDGGRTIELSGETMGTGWSLVAVVEPSLNVAALRKALEDSFSPIIGQMSQWEADSQISRFNRAQPGSRMEISRQFAHVLDCAVQIAEASDGAFDPVIGAASDLWGFGPDAGPQTLPEVEAAAQTRHLSWRDLDLGEGGAAPLQPGGLQLDLSAIAKGFAVDLGIHVIEAMGIRHALLEIGGEFRGMGVRGDGLPWWVDVELPPGSDAPHARIGLSGWALATSGNYLRRRCSSGRSWSHTIDPVSGMPLADNVQSVSVLHHGCMQADALATAITVMGQEAGIAFADRHAIPARVVAAGGTATSAAWRSWLE